MWLILWYLQFKKKEINILWKNLTNQLILSQMENNLGVLIGPYLRLIQELYYICKSFFQELYEREQDSSPTRQFTDTVFEDSSPTDLKTVHRHFWRQFIDTFYHVIDIWLENIIDYCEEILMSYDLRWYVDIICWESDNLFVWLMINRRTFDCHMKLYWCDPIANRTLFLMKFASNSKHSYWIFKQICSGLPSYFYLLILR